MKNAAFAALLFVTATLSLSSCSGGAPTRTLPAASTPAGATLTVTIPNGANIPSSMRKIRTIGGGSASIVVRYVGGNNSSFGPGTAFVIPESTAIALGTPVNLTTGPGGNCTSSAGSLTCTLSGIVLPVGKLDLYILDYDGPNGTGDLIYGSVTVVQFNANGTFTTEYTNDPVTWTPLQLNPAYYSPPPSSAAQLVYITDRTQNAVLAYPTGQGGNLYPAKIIMGSQTQLSSPAYLSFDSAGNLYVANGSAPSGILVYAKGSSANAAPTRIISGANTTFPNAKFLEALAVDSLGYVYVAESTASKTCTLSTCTPVTDDTIVVFAPGANGNVAPVRTLSSSACFGVGGLAVAPSGELYAACDGFGGPPPAPPGGEIVTFAPGASGNAIPLTTIQNDECMAHTAGALALSPLGTVIVSGSTEFVQVCGFPETANGYVSETMFLGYTQGAIAVDSVGTIYVASGPQILEYASSASGAPPPALYTISGSDTGMSGTSGIALGPP